MNTTGGADGWKSLSYMMSNKRIKGVKNRQKTSRVKARNEINKMQL